MPVWMAMAAQTASMAGPPGTLAAGVRAAPLVAIPDLLRAVPPCPSGAAGSEVVVCGKHTDPYRVRPLPPTAERALPRAETSLMGGHAAIETEGASVGGVPSNRVMLRLKLPF